MNPSSGTRKFIIANDLPFAEQVVAHNKFGETRKCWKGLTQ